jgi:hypothetical protein
LLNGGHHIRRAEVYLLARGCAAGNQIRAHTLIGVMLSAAKNLGLFWRVQMAARVAKNVTRPSHKSYGLEGALLKMTQVRESANAPQPGLFEQWPTRLFKGRVCDHTRGRRIRRV